MYKNDLIARELFASNSFLPAQHSDSHSRENEPERRLMLAMLTDALRCFQAGIATRNGPRAKLFAEAERWLFTEDRNAPFAFEDACDALDIDAAYLRLGLGHWAARRLLNEELPLIRRSPVILRTHVTPRKFKGAAPGGAGIAAEYRRSGNIAASAGE